MQNFEDWHKEHAKYMEPVDIVHWCKDAYETGLANREAQIVMLREVLEKVRGHGRLHNLFSCVGSDSYDPECADLNAQKCRELAEEALAATADLKDVRLCEKEPIGWCGTSGVGELIVSKSKIWNFLTTPLYRAWEPK